MVTPKENYQPWFDELLKRGHRLNKRNTHLTLYPQRPLSAILYAPGASKNAPLHINPNSLSYRSDIVDAVYPHIERDGGNKLWDFYQVRNWPAFIQAIFHSSHAKTSRHQWWSTDRTERYWLECTDRDDVGSDLRAPATDESGKDNWRYSLFKEAMPGDVVFHYHGPQDAVIGLSRIAGPWLPHSIVWGARGSFAREKGVKPHKRPGYVVPLTDYKKLPMPLTLGAMRESVHRIRAVLNETEELHPHQALYFPFELGMKRPLRPLQGYAFKLPRAFVLAFPELSIFDVSQFSEADDSQKLSARDVASASGRLGQGYRVSLIARKAIEAHAMDAAQEYFSQLGYVTTDVSATRPYDLIVEKNGEQFTVEVKGTTTGADSVLLTKNEVAHARSHPTQAVLYVLHSIQLKHVDNEVVANSGSKQVYWPWHLIEESLEALQYKYTLPRSSLVAGRK